MHINNNINSMVQLERKLDQSAKELTKLNDVDNNINEDVNLVNEMVKQIEIPLAYTANAEVILSQDSMTRTLLDIKA